MALSARKTRTLIAAVSAFIIGYFQTHPAAAREKVYVADFDQEQLDQWDQKSFAGETRYQIIERNGKNVLQAQSQKTASGLAKPMRINLKETPFINWSWKIRQRLDNLEETKKSGDDYAARIYVIIDGGWQLWKTKALNYVWSSNQPRGSEWDNAFAGSSAKMVAIRGKNDPLEWQQEKRNVYQDLITAFGDKGSDKANEAAYGYIDAIAVMTDTDNSGASATAWYGDIFFSEQ